MTQIKNKKKKSVYRVVLAYKLGLSHSVFVRAYDREDAERRALRQNPEATGIDHAPHPQN